MKEKKLVNQYIEWDDAIKAGSQDNVICHWAVTIYATSNYIPRLLQLSFSVNHAAHTMLLNARLIHQHLPGDIKGVVRAACCTDPTIWVFVRQLVS